MEALKKEAVVIFRELIGERVICDNGRKASNRVPV